jgi:hypothetical protein
MNVAVPDTAALPLMNTPFVSVREAAAAAGRETAKVGAGEGSHGSPCLPINVDKTRYDDTKTAGVDVSIVVGVDDVVMEDIVMKDGIGQEADHPVGITKMSTSSPSLVPPAANNRPTIILPESGVSNNFSAAVLGSQARAIDQPMIMITAPNGVITPAGVDMSRIGLARLGDLTWLDLA